MSTNAISVIVAYDLPSENIRALNSALARKVRAVRVASTELLHRLGLQCTESVILVAPSKVEYVGDTINRVRGLYARLPDVTFAPVIEVIRLTAEQQGQFITLAKRRLIERIDEGINRISELFDEIDAITEVRERRNIAYRLTRVRREYTSIMDLARDLGITDVSADYLINLIDNLLSKVGA
jgi:hypothetical protein